MEWQLALMSTCYKLESFKYESSMRSCLNCLNCYGKTHRKCGWYLLVAVAIQRVWRVEDHSPLARLAFYLVTKLIHPVAVGSSTDCRPIIPRFLSLRTSGSPLGLHCLIRSDEATNLMSWVTVPGLSSVRQPHWDWLTQGWDIQSHERSNCWILGLSSAVKLLLLVVD